MRNFIAKATLSIVGVLSFFGMSHFAYGAILSSQLDSSSEQTSGSLQTNTFTLSSGQVIGDIDIYVGNGGSAGNQPRIIIEDSSNTAYCSSYAQPQTAMTLNQSPVLSVLSFSMSGCSIPSTGSYRIDFQGSTDTIKSKTDGSGHPYFVLYDGVSELFDTSTRIISLTPANGACVGFGCPNATSTFEYVDFGIHAYISPDDVGDILSVAITLHNIDQNVLLLSAFSPSDIVLLDHFQVATSRDFFYSTTTIIVNGNYRLNAVLESKAFGFINNLFRGTIGIFDEENTQFVVGKGTFLGNISQNTFEQYGSILASSTATSTASLAHTCSPVSTDVSTFFLNSQFDVISCLTFLFVPDAGYVQDTIDNFRDNVITHFPFGYLTRFYDIMITADEVELPELSYTFGSSSPSVLQGKTYSIQIYDYLGEDSPLNQVRTDDGEDKTLWDVVNPPITTLVIIMVTFVILNDLLGIAIGGELSRVKRTEAKQKLFQQSTTSSINSGSNKRRIKSIEFDD